MTGLTLIVPFNNTQTLKLKAQPTNAFFATINLMFGSSSQLLTTAVDCFGVYTVLNDLITCMFGNSRKLGGAAKHLIDGSQKKAFVA